MPTDTAEPTTEALTTTQQLYCDLVPVADRAPKWWNMPEDWLKPTIESAPDPKGLRSA